MSNWTQVAGQENQADFTSGGTLPIALATANATAGNVVVVGIVFYDGTGVTPTISSAQDENGKLYTQIAAGWSPDTAAASGNTTILYLIVPSGAGKTVTIQFSNPVRRATCTLMSSISPATPSRSIIVPLASTGPAAQRLTRRLFLSAATTTYSMPLPPARTRLRAGMPHGPRTASKARRAVWRSTFLVRRRILP